MFFLIEPDIEMVIKSFVVLYLKCVFIQITTSKCLAFYTNFGVNKINVYY